MKNFLHKIASFSLAIFVLFSSFSFTINQHICGGKIANTEFFTSADNCGMKIGMCANKNLSKETSIQRESCCKDISILFQGNDIIQQTLSLVIASPLLLVPFTVIHFLENQKIINNVSFLAYRPPLIYKDVSTLFQVFRI